MRAILSFMANARRVAYLDDDNAWLLQHLDTLSRACLNKAWAFSLRILMRAEDGVQLGIDRWDSLGPDKGRFTPLGGFVDPNCLMVDKVATASCLGRWAETANGMPGDIADRHVFDALRHLPHGETQLATVLYEIRKTNVLHSLMAQDRNARQSGILTGADTTTLI